MNLIASEEETRSPLISFRALYLRIRRCEGGRSEAVAGNVVELGEQHQVWVESVRVLYIVQVKLKKQPF